MLGCPAFLDSTALADLRELLSSGVGKSEVLVVLISKGYLTRSVHNLCPQHCDALGWCLSALHSSPVGRSPWCLLEICEAMRLNKPIVLLKLKGAGRDYSLDEAFELLDDLEINLRELNPAGIAELRAQAKQSLEEVATTVRQALIQALVRASCTSVWHGNNVPNLNING
jgi:hypothetical protein